MKRDSPPRPKTAPPLLRKRRPTRRPPNQPTHRKGAWRKQQARAIPRRWAGTAAQSRVEVGDSQPRVPLAADSAPLSATAADTGNQQRVSRQTAGAAAASAAACTPSSPLFLSLLSRPTHAPGSLSLSLYKKATTTALHHRESTGE